MITSRKSVFALSSVFAALSVSFFTVLEASPGFSEELSRPLVAYPDGAHVLRLKLIATESPVEVKGKDQVFKISNAFVYDQQTGGLIKPGSLIPRVWALNPSDKLKITFENQLTDSTYGETNLHTHGFLVPPTGKAPYGDYVLFTVPPQTTGNGGATAMTHVGMGHGGAANQDQKVKYDIDLPSDHPPGLFWYHPHPHGISQRQLAGGMAGLITVGQLGDSACIGKPDSSGKCPKSDDIWKFKDYGKDANIRYLMLKDIYVTIDNEDPKTKTISATFKPDAVFPKECVGSFKSDAVCTTSDGANSWLFTVNGQLAPDIHVKSKLGEVWRIANMSANMTYDLELVDDHTNAKIEFTVIAKDGVAIPQKKGANKKVPHLVLMPAGRADILVENMTPDVHATFRSAEYDSGGDTWPQVSLAHVTFSGTQPEGTGGLFVSAPVARSLSEMNSDLNNKLTTMSAEKPSPCTAVDAEEKKPGWNGEDNLRIVWFGNKVVRNQQDNAPANGAEVKFTDDPLLNADRVENVTVEKLLLDSEDWDKYKIPEPFMMANEVGNATLELDKTTKFPKLTSYKREKAGDGRSIVNLRLFDMGRTDTCIKAGHWEKWMLVNTTEEVHNFHIHQSKFEVWTISDPKDITKACGEGVKKCSLDGEVHDTVPVPPLGYTMIRIGFGAGGSSAGGLLDKKNGAIQAGDFVYHCHILEHEDGGMMSKITVLPRGKATAAAAGQ